MKAYAQQCWWITGASSGIGDGLARALASRGAHLILSGRNAAALQALAEQCNDALVLPFEVTDYSALADIVQRAWAWKGRIHGLINNAGISQRSLAVETQFSVYQKVIEVDLLAPIALTQQVLPRMVQSGGGSIVAISSVAGIVGAPLRSAYSAAKHGLIGYHDSVRAENEHRGIQVHVVAPGSVKTNVSRNAVTANGSARGESDPAIESGMLPDEFATQVLAALDAGKREIILATGSELGMAVLRRQDPEQLFDRMSSMVRDGYVQKMAASRA